MKKLKYLILVPVFFLMFSLNAHALDCAYQTEDKKIQAVFTITESNGQVSIATVRGYDPFDSDSYFQIQNWNSVFKPIEAKLIGYSINAKGIDYYRGYNECPPYALILEVLDMDDDGMGDFAHFAVSTESHLKEFKALYKVIEMQRYKQIYAKDGGGGGETDPASSCASYKDPGPCKTSKKFSCVWNETKYGNYCNTDNLTYIQCGDAFDIPSQVPSIISFIINLLKIATPIILIFVGMFTLIKALAASKEDEITKAKNSLVKKIIAAVIVFFVISIVQFVMSLVADEGEAEDVTTCISCLLNNDCEWNTYYKTYISGTYMCTSLNGGKTEPCQGNK